MDKVDISQSMVEDTLRAIHRQNYERIAQLPIRNLVCLRQRLRQSEGNSDEAIGHKIAEYMQDVIAGLKPSGEHDDTNRLWQTYAILTNYYLDVHANVKKMEGLFVISRSLFHDRRDVAVQTLTTELQRIESEARQSQRRNSLSERDWAQWRTEYCRRFDGDTDLLESLLNILRGRVWAIVITGVPGMGKTKIAYELGQNVYSKGEFTDVIAARLISASADDAEQETTEEFAIWDDLLIQLGKELGRRDLVGKATGEKERLIFDALDNRKALLIIDDLDNLRRTDWKSLGRFLMKMPEPTRAVLTSRERSGDLDNVTSFPLGRMQEAEALDFMRAQARQRHISPMPSDAQLRLIYQHPLGGVPAVIQAFMGIIQDKGFSPAAVIEEVLDHANAGESSQRYIEALHKLLDQAYDRLGHRDWAAVRILHLLTLFRTPAQQSAIAAVMGLGAPRIRSALGLLYQMFFTERIYDDQLSAAYGPESSQPELYDLQPFAREFVLGIKHDGMLLSGADQDVTRDVFLNNARMILAQYYVGQFRARSIGPQILYLGAVKDTLFELLAWYRDNKEWSKLISIVNQIGRPLAILGGIEDRRRWGEAAVTACEESSESDSQEQREWFLVHDVAWSHARLGKSDIATKIWRDSLEVARQKGFRKVEALALRNLSQQMASNDAEQAQLDQAVAQLNRSIQIWQEIKEFEWLGHTQQVLGRILYQQCKWSEALTALRLAHGYLLDQGHNDGIISTLADMSLVVIELEQSGEAKAGEAERMSKEAIGLAKDLTPPAPALAYSRWRRAQLYERCKVQHDQVIAEAREAIAIYEACFASRWKAEAERWLTDFIQRTTRTSKRPPD